MRENMSSNELLARRAVACKGWRWMEGMALHGRGVFGRIIYADPRGGLLVAGRNESGAHMEVRLTPMLMAELECAPDLTDPAMLGCLLALVREAWGDVQIIMTYSPCVGWWNLYFDEHPDRVEFVGLSLAEALVAALEAAP